MKYHPLGSTAIQVSRIGFGCMSLPKEAAEAEKLIHQAIDGGINYFDTADMYDKGVNETNVGKALQHKRTDIVIATKVGNQWRSDGSGWDWNPRKDYIMSAVEESLKRLQTDYIDLYQLHGGTMEDPIDDVIEAFELLQQQGKIRCYGISSIRPAVIREYVSRSKIASVMMQYSLLDRRPEEACLPLLLEHTIAVMVRGSVASGLLVNKPAKVYLNYNEKQVQHAAEAVRSVSIQQRNPAQTAIQFALHPPATTAAVVGIRTKEQLEEALKAIGTPELKDDEIETLIRSVPVNVYEQHR